MNTGHLFPLGVGLTLSSSINLFVQEPGTFNHWAAIVTAVTGCLFIIIGFIWRWRNGY